MARTSSIKKLGLTAKDFSFCVELPIKAKRAGYKISLVNLSKEQELLEKKGKRI